MKIFIDRLIEAIIGKKTPLVVGIDPDSTRIPAEIIEEKPFLGEEKAEFMNAVSSIRKFSLSIIDAVNDLVPAVKIQQAFFERYGCKGLGVMIETIKYARRKGLLVILDAKKNDIANTARAYSDGILGKVNSFGEEDDIFSVDALTINPYFGSDGIVPFVEDCQKYGKGIFVLIKTSNSSSTELQDLYTFTPQQIGKIVEYCQYRNYYEHVGLEEIMKYFGTPVYERVAKLIDDLGQDQIGDYGYSSIGGVVGITSPNIFECLREKYPNLFFLVPGFGAQGGKMKDLSLCFDREGLGAIINSSRDVIYAQEKPEFSHLPYQEAIRQDVISLKKDINEFLKRKSK